VKVSSLERLIQIAVILGKATEDAGNMFHSTTVYKIYNVDQFFLSLRIMVNTHLEIIEFIRNSKKEFMI